MTQALADPRATVEWESWIEGPRWAGLPDFIERLAMDASSATRKHGLEFELVYLRERKSLLRTSIYFEVRGPRASVEAFRKVVMKAIKDYQTGF